MRKEGVIFKKQHLNKLSNCKIKGQALITTALINSWLEQNIELFMP
jgi:hypothetical protein